MASAAVHSKVVVDSLFIVVPIVCVGFLLCYAVFCILSIFAIITLGKREMVALLLLSS